MKKKKSMTLPHYEENQRPPGRRAAKAKSSGSSSYGAQDLGEKFGEINTSLIDLNSIGRERLHEIRCIRKIEEDRQREAKLEFLGKDVPEEEGPRRQLHLRMRQDIMTKYGLN